MGEVIDLTTVRTNRLQAEPTLEGVHQLPVMPLALGEDRPLADCMFTLPDGRMARVFASDQYQQQYLVALSPVERSELINKDIQ